MSTATVKERPILFRGEMTRAILSGRKTQTRRIADTYASNASCTGHFARLSRNRSIETDERALKFCRYGVPGDRLWVRETWKAFEDPETLVDGILFQADGAFQEIENTRKAAELWAEAAHRKPAKSDYKPIRAAGQGHLGVATCKKHVGWRPSIFMPRWASRISLEITDVRIERLNDISEADAIAEGIEGNSEGQWKHYLKPKFGPSPVHSFQTLWESVRKPGAWAENPWVWVVEFRKIEAAKSNPSK